MMSKPPLNPSYRFFFMNGCKNQHCSSFSHLQLRRMTSSKRVQDRSKFKRVHDLEIAAEKHKVMSKILHMFEILKGEPENIVPLRNLDKHRKQINLPKPNKFSDFLRKAPKLFEMYKDSRGVIWCGMTPKAEDLAREEEEIIEKNGAQSAEYVTRLLMMAADKRLRLDKVAHFRRDFGFPMDFRKNWVHNYPENFKVVQPFRPFDDTEYLELVSWNPNSAITELEKTVVGVTEDHVPGLLSLPFPLKFPATYKKLYRDGGKIAHFQKREYLSPYADGSGLQAGSLEFDKRAVAIMHELLSFSIEKRLVTDHFTHFRHEFNMPQKLMRLLLKHCGIFYVSDRGRRFSAFLNEAYDRSELVQKHPLVVWRENVLSHVGFRGKKKRIETSADISDSDEKALFMSGSEDDDHIALQLGLEEKMHSLDDASDSNESEMDVEVVRGQYDD
ncbi:protein WHAT'S THIS FACTOR 1, chloroplastic-like [Salvia divinorum]|uniref:Protein WHAT'S THIS FACTOR 1, chloroplastic-like n=1 Tax=Salvia divinorum TaxID=28513 RepID=A0ABD1GT78_SALDI